MPSQKSWIDKITPEDSGTHYLRDRSGSPLVQSSPPDKRHCAREQMDVEARRKPCNYQGSIVHSPPVSHKINATIPPPPAPTLRFPPPVGSYRRLGLL